MDTVEEIKGFLKSREKANLIMVLANIVVYVVLTVMGNTTDGYFMLQHGASYTPYILEGEYYRLFTAMFLHFGLAHIGYNMLCLIFLGDVLEKEVGVVRYLIIYLAGGLAGNLFSMALELRDQEFHVSAGASGAIFAVVGALLYLVLKNRGQLGTITLRSLLLMIVVTLGQGFTEVGTDNAAHVGGLIGGFVLAVFVCVGRKRKIRT